MINYLPVLVPCECGCGGLHLLFDSQKRRRKYIKGHSNKNVPISEESKEKMRQAKLGKTLTEEHKQKISLSLGGKKKPPRTKEHCDKLSKSLEGKHNSPNTEFKNGLIPHNKGKDSKITYVCENCEKEFKDYLNDKRKFCSVKCQHEYPMSENTRNKLSVSHSGVNNHNYGKKFTDEEKEHLRKISKGKHRSPDTEFKKGQIQVNTNSWGMRNKYVSPHQGEVCLRSNYELEYAKYLDKNNKDWLYEPQTFDLGSTTYTPDFYLIKEDKFIEIKGYMTNKSSEKMNMFLKKYSEKLEILYKEDLINIGCFI